MNVTQLVLASSAPAGRGGYTPTLPHVDSLPELAPHLSSRLSRCRRAGELWIELEPLPAPRAEAAPALRRALLRTASLRVRNRVRGTDEVVQVGEQGLAVLLLGAGAPEAALVANRLRHTLTGAYELEGRLAYLGVAMGEAVYPDSGTSGTELARAAQQSLALRQGS
jgi:predicted signal transduction protein with EAL and GGDEF domain